MPSQKLEIYDTTLRDGSQAEGISFSVNDKLKIVSLLDELGVDYIEAGWPGANPKDIEVFQQVQKMDLKNAVITAFGCTRKANVKPEEDKVLEQLLIADTKVITLFGKSWDFHVEHALRTTLEENLNMISDSIAYLKSQGKRVFFDAEHFYDGYKNNPKYSLDCLEAAHKAGSERLILCDTNGGCIPSEIKEITEIVRNHFPEAYIGIHAHNDGDLAVANSIIAIQAGAIQVQGTFNGYGERCGNANLCSVIPNLQVKLEQNIIGEKLSNLVYVARQISEIANRKANDYAPYVGLSAFTHKAGIHASGVKRNSSTYEHIDPEAVGNTRRILVSDQAGTASIKEKIAHLKLDIDLNDKNLKKILSNIKKLEWQGFAFEDADASFELMVREIFGTKPRYFELKGFRVISDTTTGLSALNTEASVKIKVGKETIHTVSEGEGPGHALDGALRCALRSLYPEIKQFKLADFKVRILDGIDGTSANTRVHVETTDGFNRWDTVGVSRNIIEATYLAIVDSIVYGLMIHNVEPQNGYHSAEDLTQFV
ncbi:MAG: citramalate synthase [Candidatus Melainabacteria bacterium RIFOXYA12_FULL_32_12]|nr:MAG: citramalate synthase [Candidatus Melainabacteria bacterium RIFOXYA2_FULL_32_9]OGI28271.1 MAG: citramalate synthase [Candidatus Melainabacteria bacterium RIFOXYA12_FULL_32_12]